MYKSASKLLLVSALTLLSGCVVDPGYGGGYGGDPGYGYNSYNYAYPEAYSGDVWSYNYYDAGWNHNHHENYSYRYNDWHRTGRGVSHGAPVSHAVQAQSHAQFHGNSGGGEQHGGGDHGGGRR